jgi:hypothetical protein
MALTIGECCIASGSRFYSASVFPILFSTSLLCLRLKSSYAFSQFLLLNIALICRWQQLTNAITVASNAELLEDANRYRFRNTTVFKKIRQRTAETGSLNSMLGLYIKQKVKRERSPIQKIACREPRMEFTRYTRSLNVSLQADFNGNNSVCSRKLHNSQLPIKHNLKIDVFWDMTPC